MSFEIKNNRVEMSEQELDFIAGGVVGVDLGDYKHFIQNSGSNYKATNSEIADYTVASPGGSATGTTAQLQQTQSNSHNNIIVG
ncbi:CTB family bacteriocin [Scytonema sp. HK-05]|uniref:CTB family bacteriocin n=1 Tax=Scytonema sp. HK-05 TaxID=1137095 RepID=UPI0011610859|nr:CTB family bacteriocin [Scytonema sp. HK-05]